MECVLIIDAGTTSVRATLFDSNAFALASHQLELEQHFPKPGWVEHDPEEIWSKIVTCCAKVLAEAGSVIGLGITNQRETTVVWEKETGKCLGNAIVWQDRRTADYCNALKTKHESVIRAKTGLLLDPYFSAPKLNWMLDHYQVLNKAKEGDLLFGTIDTFLLWRLTKGQVHATDMTNASRTLLFNIKKQCWDDELLEIFQIPKAMLPEVKENTGNFGVVEQTLFKKSIPVVAMIGDQQAASIGQGCLNHNDAKCTYGTGAFLMIDTGNQIATVDHLLNTIAYCADNRVNYAIEGSIFAAGTIIKWLRDQMGLINHAAQVDCLASSLDDNGGVYLIPAFTGLGAPYWDALARGAIFGLTRDTRPSHIVRAGLEAIAYQTKDLLNILQDQCQLAKLRVDGGVTASAWLMQFLADLLGIPIEVNANKEATSLGTAYLSLFAVGVIKDFASIRDLPKIESVFQPNMSRSKADALYSDWLDAVRRTRHSYN